MFKIPESTAADMNNTLTVIEMELSYIGMEDVSVCTQLTDLLLQKQATIILIPVCILYYNYNIYIVFSLPVACCAGI